MSTRKGQNSILFLTTLGVYLGLVIAGGASPQVFAHPAATTRNFDITDEIEFKDDLDDVPNGCQSLEAKVEERRKSFLFDNESLLKYLTALRGVFSAARNIGTDSLELGWQSFGDPSPINGVSAWMDGNGRPILLQGRARRDLDKAVFALSHIFPTAGPDGGHDFGFLVSLSRSDIVSTAKLIRQNALDAHQAFIAYDSSLDYWRCANTAQPTHLLARNTQLTWSDNQVFVVTRLPRGSLDDLLATDAK